MIGIEIKGEEVSGARGDACTKAGHLTGMVKGWRGRCTVFIGDR